MAQIAKIIVVVVMMIYAGVLIYVKEQCYKRETMYYNAIKKIVGNYKQPNTTDNRDSLLYQLGRSVYALEIANILESEIK